MTAIGCRVLLLRDYLASTRFVNSEHVVQRSAILKRSPNEPTLRRVAAITGLNLFVEELVSSRIKNMVSNLVGKIEDTIGSKISTETAWLGAVTSIQVSIDQKLINQAIRLEGAVTAKLVHFQLSFTEACSAGNLPVRVNKALSSLHKT